MRRRCTEKKQKSYPDYGGRGITYDEKWFTFEGFWEDMQYGYSDELTLDRINNDGNYCKENCRWATRLEQSRNKRNSIVFNNETQRQAALRLSGGKNETLVRLRIKKLKWSVEDAFTKPIHSYIMRNKRKQK